jgi:hypothetical protein
MDKKKPNKARITDIITLMINPNSTKITEMQPFPIYK